MPDVRPSPKTVAVIGVGNLGLAIARRLLDSGFTLIACDRDPHPLEELGRAGALTTNVAGHCADADAALVVVATPGQLADVADALAASPSTRRLKHVAVMSTVPRAAVVEVHEPLAEAGIAVINAPVSGGARRAGTGELTVMADGSADDVEALREILQCLASNIFHCGSVGAGHAVKAINNVLCHANIALTAEALRLASEHGLEPERLLPVMEVSSGRNWLTPDLDKARDQFWTIGVDRATCDGTLDIMREDLAIAVDMTAGRETSPAINGPVGIFAVLGSETFDNWHGAGRRPRGDE